jgi:hypothetical protein
MSEIENTRKELRRILDMIPASGSFESARLATQASELAIKYADLVTSSSSKNLMHGLASSPNSLPPEERTESPPKADVDSNPASQH